MQTFSQRECVDSLYAKVLLGTSLVHESKPDSNWIVIETLYNMAGNWFWYQNESYYRIFYSPETPESINNVVNNNSVKWYQGQMIIHESQLSKTRKDSFVIEDYYFHDTLWITVSWQDYLNKKPNLIEITNLDWLYYYKFDSNGFLKEKWGSDNEYGKVKTVFNRSGNLILCTEYDYCRLLLIHDCDNSNSFITGFQLADNLPLNYAAEAVFHGNHKEYYDSGMLKVIGYYEKGEKTGHWIFYDEDGEIINLVDY